MQQLPGLSISTLLTSVITQTEHMMTQMQASLSHPKILVFIFQRGFFSLNLGSKETG